MDKRKAALLRNLQQDTYCRIAVSSMPDAGVGVVAVKPIPRGVNPFRRNDDTSYEIISVSPEELQTLSKQVQKMVADFFFIDDNGNYPVVYNGLNGIDISFYMNHDAERPNVDMIATDSPYYEFVANREIQPGEELIFDYKGDVKEKFI